MHQVIKRVLITQQRICKCRSVEDIFLVCLLREK